MVDKLKTSHWTDFAKKRDLDDAALVKALTKFDATSDTKPEARRDALAEVITQITKLIPALAKRKKELGDKPFDEAKAKLYGILDEAETLQKTLLAAQKTEAKADASEDEEDSPALLTTRMVPLLRQLRQPDVRMHALICTAGKNTAVLIMAKPIGMPRRKLLSEAVDAKGGAKFIVAECLFENGALTFVIQGSASNLAKRITAALLAQTKLRLKVRVRGEDGSEEVDGEDEAPATPGAPGRPEAKPSTAEAQWAQRSPGVIAAVEAALKAQHPQSSKLRAVVGFASEKAHVAKDYEAAVKSLDMLVQLLKSAPGGNATATPTQGTPATPTGTPPKAPPLPLPSAQVYGQSSQIWRLTLDKVKGEIGKLKLAILNDYRQSPVLKEIVASTRKLDDALHVFDKSLQDKLDEAAKATAPDARQRLHGEVHEAIKRFQVIAGKDKLLAALDDNPFEPIGAQKALTTALAALAAKLP